MPTDSPSDEIVCSVQPVVLVGGKSLRFGRDKLREPWGNSGNPLVQRPIDALREVFGPRVKLVGHCHASLLPLGDGTLPDLHPHIGPIGGIASALVGSRCSIFVLAGDMPSFTSTEIRRLLAKAETARTPAWAVLASADGVHPCAGVYTLDALPILQARIARDEHGLMHAIPEPHRLLVECPAHTLANVNHPTDIALPASTRSPGYADA